MVNFCQISNLLGVFPILLAVQFGMYDMALAMTCATCLSIVYHHDETNEMALWADIGGCSLALSFVLQTMMNTNMDPSPAHILCVIYAVMAMTFYLMAGNPGTEEYHYFHTGWHVCMFYTTSLFVYTHVHSTTHRHVSKSVITRPIWPIIKPVIGSVISRARGKFAALRGVEATSDGIQGTGLTAPATDTHFVLIESESGGKTEIPLYIDPPIGATGVDGPPASSVGLDATSQNRFGNGSENRGSNRGSNRVYCLGHPAPKHTGSRTVNGPRRTVGKTGYTGKVPHVTKIQALENRRGSKSLSRGGGGGLDG